MAISSAGKASACILVAALACAVVGTQPPGTGPDLSRVTSLFSDSSGGITAPDAVRLSKQAAFGPTQTLVDH
ncbi:MAG: hypothetical protein ABIO39_05320, partial [Caulobacteraceae bacterium]